MNPREPQDVQPEESGWWLASDGRWYPPESAPAPPTTEASGESGVDRSVPVAWWDSTWFFVVSILFCFPVALVLLWRKPWNRAVKIGVTAAAAVFVVVSIASGSPSETNRDASSTSTNESFKPLLNCADGTQVSDLDLCSEPTSSTSSTTTTTQPAPPPTQPPPTTQPAPIETAGQSNARRSALQYLDLGKGFSRDGLIKQLSSSYGEGFSLADATYGVDATHTDWNEQACIAARTYLGIQPFSHAGLVEQLSSQYGEQFTLSQAEYGVTCAGL